MKKKCPSAHCIDLIPLFMLNCSVLIKKYQDRTFSENLYEIDAPEDLHRLVATQALCGSLSTGPGNQSLNPVNPAPLPECAADHVLWPMQCRGPMAHFTGGVLCCEGPSPLCTSTSMTRVAQQPISGKCSHLLSWDSFQPDLFPDLLPHEATPARD